MKIINELLNTFSQTKMTKEDIAQFSTAILDSVKKELSVCPPEIKTKDKEVKVNSFNPKDILTTYFKSVKKDGCDLQVDLNGGDMFKGKLVAYDPYNILLEVLETDDTTHKYMISKGCINSYTKIKD